MDQEMQQKPEQKQSPRKRPPPRAGDNLYEETDIGSGEKTPAQLDTEEDIKSIPPLPHDTPPATPSATS